MIHILTMYGDGDTDYVLLLATTRKLTKKEVDMLDEKVTAYKDRYCDWSYGGIENIFKRYAKEQGIYVPIRQKDAYYMEQ